MVCSYRCVTKVYTLTTRERLEPSTMKATVTLEVAVSSVTCQIVPSEERVMQFVCIHGRQIFDESHNNSRKLLLSSIFSILSSTVPSLRQRTSADISHTLRSIRRSRPRTSPRASKHISCSAAAGRVCRNRVEIQNDAGDRLDLDTSVPINGYAGWKCCTGGHSRSVSDIATGWSWWWRCRGRVR